MGIIRALLEGTCYLGLGGLSVFSLIILIVMKVYEDDIRTLVKMDNLDIDDELVEKGIGLTKTLFRMLFAIGVIGITLMICL